MEKSSIIKHLLTDDESLLEYSEGILVDYCSIKRRLFLLERNESKFIPDHYYKLNQEKSFEKLRDTISSVLTYGLFDVAEKYLEYRGKRIYVKQKMQNQWQELITRIPPLVLQAVYMFRHYPLVASNTTHRMQYLNEYILPNIKYTALPFPYLAQMEDFITSNNGLHDLHMHLNGSTETDNAWQDFLNNPDKIYHDLSDGFSNQMVKEQFEQESSLLTPLKYYDLLKIARRIRNYLFDIVCHEDICADQSNCGTLTANNTKELLLKIIDLNTEFYDGYGNPFAKLVGQCDFEACYPMAIECLMYVKVFGYMSESPRESIANLFHFYLLILGLTNRLLVQQTHQYGFQQFQKHTVNELRSEIERTYRNRFFQLQGNELRNLRFLEGRFAPKNTQLENENLLSKIIAGWTSLRDNIDSEEKPELKFIAHFIKVADNSGDPMFRHKKLRSEVWNKATVLGFMKSNHHPLLKDFVGIDAAASEFDTPPEVFAPSFRMLRRRGVENFTYHAGEDFFHIISGLRAIYEAIDFLEFRNGDRIGHAVASGVDPVIWINNVGKKILIRKGDYMDDLLFVYYFIIEHEIIELKTCLPFIGNKISALSSQVYGDFYPVELQIEVWKLRKYCPMLLLTDERQYAEPFRVFCDEEYLKIRNILPTNQPDKRKDVIEKYHSKECRSRYNDIIEIEVEDVFDVATMRILQKGLLKYMHRREIVIETLPTSNVRIGNHHNFDTYHLYNWIKWKNEGLPIPPIVVGTDDTGIFATNIYNEYANIYCNLTHHHHMAHDKVMSLIREFDNNAKVYKFK